MASKNIIEIVIKATDKASKVADQVEKATDKMGKNGAKNVGLINKASERLEKTWGNVKNTMTNAMNAIRSKLEGVYNSLSNMGNRIKGVAQSFTQLIPSFSTVAETIKKKWSTTIEDIKTRTKGIRDTASSITTPFSNAFNSIRESASSSSILTQNSWVQAVRNIGTAFRSGLNGDAVYHNLTTGTYIATFDATSRWARAASTIGQSINSINTYVRGVATTVGTAFGTVETYAINTGNTIRNYLGTAFNGIVTRAQSVSSSIGSAFSGLSSRITGVATSIRSNLSSAFQSLGNSSSTALAVVNNGVANTNNQLRGLSSTAITAGTQASNAFRQLGGTLESLVAKMASFRITITSADGTVRTLGVQIQGVVAESNNLANSIRNVGNSGTGLNSVANEMRNIGNAADEAGNKTNECGNRLKGLKGKISSLSSGFSGLGGAISMAFGAVGVSSMYQFTIGAAVAREKLMSVTQSVYGGEQAANQLKTAVSKATQGTVVGFTSVMTALNRVGVQFHLTSQQASQLAPAMTSVGVVAQALGYDGTQSMNMMQKAMRGLNGDTVTLWRGFTITKEQLMQAGWSGAADDVTGYGNALQKLIGHTDEYQKYMNSAEGKQMRFKMALQGIGRTIGEVALPWLEKLEDIFVELSKHKTLMTIIVGIGLAIMGLSSASMVLLPLIQIGEALGLLGPAGVAAAAGEETAAASTGILSGALAGLEFSLGPILLVVGAIIALGVAVYEVGKYFGWWSDVSGMLDAISAGVQRLWSAFTNNKNVQAIIKGVSDGLSWLGNIIGGVIQWLFGLDSGVQGTSGEFDIVHAIIMTVGGAFDTLCGAIGNTISFFQWLYTSIVNLPTTISNLVSSIIGFITGVPGQISTALTVIGTAVANWIASLWTNISTWLNNGLATLGTWFSTLLTTLLDWGAQILGQIIAWFIMLPTVIPMYLNMIIMQVGTWIMGLINNLVLWGQTILTSIVTWLSMLPLTILTYLNFVIAYVYSWITNLWTAAVYAGSQFVNGVVQFIRLLPGRVYMFLYMTVMRVVAWALTMYQRARQTATNFVRAFIAIIQSLPGRFWSWLLSTLSRITSFASQGASRMRTTAMNMCNAFKNKVSQLPNIMWTELMHIGDKIRNAVGELGKAMRDLAHNMLNKFKDALGIHSPGYMFKAIKGEMQYIDDQLANSQKKLGKSAEKLGQGVLNGFNKTDFTDMTTPLEDATQTAQTTMQTGGAPVSANSMLGGRYTPTSDIQQENTTTPQIGSLVNTDQLTADTSLITTETQQITATIGTNSQLINTSLQGTQLTWGNLVTASNTGTQNLMANNTKTTTGYRNMTTQVGTQLNNLKSKNTSAWQNVKTTTQNNLNNILHSTKNVTTQMISAWNTMKNSIISAAQSIKSQSESRFNSLWSTISRFYHRIRNPGGAGSPSESRGSGVRRSNGGSAIRAASTGISSIFKPRKRKVQSIDLSGVFSQPEIQYMTPSGSNKMIATSDIMRYMNTKGAGWNDIVSPNNRYIRNESNKWKANGPKVYGKYPTGNDLFKVKEFENGTPQVSYETFKKMAESVFSHCNYLFYWDSERYGSWQAAAQNGNMNCSDSSDFLIALAHACGLPASKVHGHWNQFGHFWANVAGHKMDTTGWMLHRTWTPSQSHAGPAPRVNIGNNDNNSNSDDITHRGRIELDVNINLTGADKLDEATVNTVIKEALTDKNILKQIARDPNFQDYDNKMKIKMNKQITRMG